MNPRHRSTTAMSVRKGLLWGTTLLTLAVCLTGCGQQTIEGTVTLDGQPLEEGYIAFLPQKDTEGPGAGTKIEDGQFIVESPDEPLEGTYRVEITAKGKTGRKTVDGSGQRREAEGQILPKHYNTESTLEAEIKLKDENELTFELTSK